MRRIGLPRRVVDAAARPAGGEGGSALRGVLLAAGGMAIISTESVFTRLADADGFDITFWVGVFTVIVTGTITTVRDGNPLPRIRAQGRPLWVSSVLQAGMTTFFVLAVTRTSIANVVVIIAAGPLFAALFSWLLLRERTSRATWVGIVASAVGIGIVMSGSFGGGAVSGDVLALAAIVAYSLGVVLLRRHPEIDVTLVVGLGGGLMALAAVVPAVDLLGHDAVAWLALLLMGAVTGPSARMMLGSAPRHIPAAQVGLFAPMETVLATLWGFLFFDEAPAATTWIGGAVILAGLVYAIWPRPRAKFSAGATSAVA